MMVSPPKAVPAATFAVIDVSEFTVTLVAAVDPKLTADAPVRPLPMIVTVVPNGPLPGEKEVTTGTGGMMVNAALVTVRPHEVITIGPVVAPLSTVRVRLLSLVTVKAAGVPLKVTDVVPRRNVPMTYTVLPTIPLFVESEVIVG